MLLERDRGADGANTDDPRTLSVLNLGNIALDGGKFKANASRHSALSYGHIKELEEHLQGEVRKLMELAEATATRRYR